MDSLDAIETISLEQIATSTDRLLLLNSVATCALLAFAILAMLV